MTGLPWTTVSRLLPPRPAKASDASIASAQCDPNRSGSFRSWPIVDLFLASVLRIIDWSTVYLSSISTHLLKNLLRSDDILLPCLIESTYVSLKYAFLGVPWTSLGGTSSREVATHRNRCHKEADTFCLNGDMCFVVNVDTEIASAKRWGGTKI